MWSRFSPWTSYTSSLISCLQKILDIPKYESLLVWSHLWFQNISPMNSSHLYQVTVYYVFPQLIVLYMAILRLIQLLVTCALHVTRFFFLHNISLLSLAQSLHSDNVSHSTEVIVWTPFSRSPVKILSLKCRLSTW